MEDMTQNNIGIPKLMISFNFQKNQSNAHTPNLTNN